MCQPVPEAPGVQDACRHPEATRSETDRGPAARPRGGTVGLDETPAPVVRQAGTPRGTWPLREDETLAVRPERERRLRALAPDPDGDAEVRVLRVHPDGPAARREQHAAAPVDAELALVEPAGELAMAIRKAENQPARTLPVLGGDDRTEERPAWLRELDRGVLGERVEERRHGRCVLGVEPQAVAVSLGEARAEHQVHHAERHGARAAGRILGVGQTVAVVVDAVAADLDGGREAVRRAGAVRVGAVDEAVTVVVGAVVADLGDRRAHGAAGDRDFAAHVRVTGVGRALIAIVALASAGAADAAWARDVAAGPVAAAGVVRAGVRVGALVAGAAPDAPRHHVVLADAGVAHVGGAWVAVVAAGGIVLAPRAARQRHVDAARGTARIGRAGVVIVAVEPCPGLAARRAAARLGAVADVAVVAERVAALVDLPVAVVVEAVTDLDPGRHLVAEGGRPAHRDGIRGNGGRAARDAGVAAAEPGVRVDRDGERLSRGQLRDPQVERIFAHDRHGRIVR